MLPQPRRTSPRIAAGSPQDSGLPAASASSARPHSSGPSASLGATSEPADTLSPRRLWHLPAISAEYRRASGGAGAVPVGPHRRALFPHMPGYGQCVAGASHCHGLRPQGGLRVCPERFPRTPRARAPRHSANPRPPASPLPPPPFPPEPPFLRAPLSSHASGGTGSKNGPFHRAVFLGGSGDRILIAAVTLRASAVGAGPVAAAGYARHP